jgi:hypothetical protein
VLANLTIVKLIKQRKREPKKSTGRGGGQANREQNKQTQKNSMFRNNRISILVVLVLLLQHPFLVLVSI